MATTTNYSWSTPDDTALVKDGAAAIRSLGTAIDTTVFTNAGAAVAKATVDAKGDLIAGTADNTVDRLAVGANDTVLTADSSTATGLKWAAAGSSDNFALINSGGTALTGAATITVNVSGKNILYVRVVTASSANAASTFTLRLNADSGSNYIYSSLYAFDSSSLVIRTDNSTGATSHVFGVMGNDQTSNVSGHALISGANATGVKPIHLNSVALLDNSTDRSYSATGAYLGTSAITSVSIISSSGNFDAGTIYVYGA
jgi:hypothetical protein